MSNRAMVPNKKNHARQIEYLRKGIVMIPKLKDEKKRKS